MAQYGPTIVPHTTYQEFRDAVNGNGYDMDGYYGCQCWDGADLLWYQYGLTLYTGPEGYAYECWTVSRDRNAVDPFISLTGVQNIKRGDVLVWGSYAFGGVAGHIAYADEDYNGGLYMNILGQNQDAGAGISGRPFSVNSLPISGVIGIFRNTNWQGTPPTPPSQQRKKFPWVLYTKKFRSGAR